jgi:hypothetical protein
MSDNRATPNDDSHFCNIVLKQIQSGALVCPRTRQPLHRRDTGWLATADNAVAYPFVQDRVPILLADRAIAERYAQSSEKMNREYTPQSLTKKLNVLSRMRAKDYRSRSSMAAFHSIFDNLAPDAVCLSIGGGPMRISDRLLNLNIGPFPNVDIVGDAHELPYADATVDAIHCEAVFEHLHSPVVAARELFRVMKTGAKAYICTPFIQGYHGYPHHYQNYTVTGHTKLFEDAGLTILQSGPCVGPTYALRAMIATYLAAYTPAPFNKPIRLLWEALSLCIGPLDILLRDRPNAHIMASTTFVLAAKNP